MYLEVGQRLHALHGAVGAQRQGDVKGLVGGDVGHVQRLRRDETEAVLVQLQAEAAHRLHGLVGKRHLHHDLVALARESARDFEALALGRLKPDALGWDVKGCGRGRAAESENVTEEGVGALE